MSELFRDKRILILALLVLFSTLIFLWKGMNFGLEFVGGVRIPITLERPVDAETMQEILRVLKQRLNTYGIAQVVIKPIGGQEILVEIPKADERAIRSVERILKEEGKFYAIVDGQIAFTGEDVIGIDFERTGYHRATNQWLVSFGVTQEAARNFARVAGGKANEPVYMFLDRPDNAVIVLSDLELGKLEEQGIQREIALEAMERALEMRDEELIIPILLFEDENKTLEEIKRFVGSKSKVLLPESLEALKPQIESLGFKVEIVSEEASVPRILASDTLVLVERWDMVGLMSSPLLSPDLAKELESGRLITSFTISGPVPFKEEQKAVEFARERVRFIQTILLSGRLPVAAEVGSTYLVSPTLGAQFLTYSFLGLVIAIIAISLLIVIKYKRPGLVLPVIVTALVELFVLTTIIGAFGTIDLSAFAGIIAAVGGGVDDQMIVTDEVLLRRRRGEKTKQSIKRAFFVIMSDAASICLAMLPLLFSGLIEIVGFAISTLLGTILGVLITRPAYGALLEHMYGG